MKYIRIYENFSIDFSIGEYVKKRKNIYAKIIEKYDGFYYDLLEFNHDGSTKKDFFGDQVKELSVEGIELLALDDEDEDDKNFLIGINVNKYNL